MSRLACLVGRVLLPLLSLGAASCTSSLELDRFHKAEQASTSGTGSLQYQDFVFSGQQMLPHINEYFEIRIVDQSNAIQAKAVYFGVRKPDFSIVMPKSVAKLKPPYRVDYWADHNRNGKYDGVEGGINLSDHAWRRILAVPFPDDVTFTNNNTFVLDFVHDTSFTDIFTDLDGKKISGADTLLPFNLNVSGADAYVGKMLEVTVTQQPSGRLVAIHRRGAVEATYDAQVTGVCDEETNYEITAFVDMNDNGKYDAGEPSWKMDVVSSGDGVNSTLNVATAPQAPIENAETGVVGGATP